MLHNQTVERLREMNLHGMAEAFSAQAGQADVQGLAFEERFGLLVDHEWNHRQDKRLKRLLREAKLRYDACLEDIDYRVPRGLDRGVLRHLGTCEWVRLGQNALISGPTGTGKTYIACALGNAACRQGLRTLYVRVPRLLSELAISKGDGSYPKVMNRLAKTQLLILDDWGISPLGASESRDLLEVIEDRSQKNSTVAVSQLPIENWHEAIADPSMADAILDRLVHNAHKIFMKGESMRKVLKAKVRIDQT